MQFELCCRTFRVDFEPIGSVGSYGIERRVEAERTLPRTGLDTCVKDV